MSVTTEPAPTQEVVDARAVRGPAAIAAVCGRCVGVLAIGNVVVPVVGAVVTGNAIAAGFVVYVAGLAWMVALVPVALVGWPAGLLTAHLLRRQFRERVHVLVFALVGAVLCPALLALAQLPVGNEPGVALLAVGEGALGAGGGRWWTGHARRRRAARAGVAPAPDGGGAASTDAPAAG